MFKKVFVLSSLIFATFLSLGSKNNNLLDDTIEYNVNSYELNINNFYDLDFYNYQHDNFYNNELKLFEIVQDGGQILESDNKAPEGNYIKIITKSNNLLDITYYSISDENFTNISNNSLSLDLLDKNERAKILEAHSYESNYRSSSAINESSGISLLSSNNASLIDYKDYTSSDGAIDEFIDINEKNEPTYVDKFNDNRYGSDNLIVNIIPKELFTKINKTYSAGTEYGFYINTYNSGRYLESNYIIFDVDIKVINNQHSYFYIDVPINGFSKYDEENNVVFSYTEGSNLAITNIESNFSLYNNNGYNPGNSGYNITNDQGTFFTTSELSINASVHNNEIDPETLKSIILSGLSLAATLASYIPNPIVSKIGKFVGLLTKTISNIIEIDDKVSQLNMSDNKDESQKFAHVEITHIDQNIDFYKLNGLNLPRGIYDNTFRNVYEQENQYLMLKQKEDYYAFFSTMYYYNNMKDNTDDWSSTLTYLYSLDIIQDNGNYTDIPFLANIGIEYSTLISQYIAFPQNKNIVTNTKYYITYPITSITKNNFAKLIFTPKETGNYILSFVLDEFKTIPNINYNYYDYDYDAQMHIYDSNNNLIISDKNSGYGNNPLVITNLKANNTYSIYVSSDDYEYNAGNGYFQIFRYSTGYNMDGMTNSAIPMQTTTSNSDPAIYKLTPTTEGRYSIFTSQGSSHSLCDTYLELYDEQFRKLAFNDNFVGNYSKVEWYLEKQKTYYISIKNKSSGSRQFKLNIIDDQVIHEKNFGNPITLYTVCSTYKRYSYITLYTSKSSTHYLYTENLSGHRDITLTIYDDKMNQIAFDDDSRGNNQPYISVYLQANRYYYLFIKMIINETYAPSSVFNLVIGG